jgi:glutaredoxin 3
MGLSEQAQMDQQKIVVYTSGACGYTWRAKRLLTAKGYVFEVVDLTFDPRRRAWLAEQTGRRTVPQIKIGERWVGGFDEISALDAQGELDRIVAGAA